MALGRLTVILGLVAACAAPSANESVDSAPTPHFDAVEEVQGEMWSPLPDAAPALDAEADAGELVGFDAAFQDNPSIDVDADGIVDVGQPETSSGPPLMCHAPCAGYTCQMFDYGTTHGGFRPDHFEYESESGLLRLVGDWYSYDLNPGKCKYVAPHVLPPGRLTYVIDIATDLVTDVDIEVILVSSGFCSQGATEPLCALISEPPLPVPPPLEFTVDGADGISKTYTAFHGSARAPDPWSAIPLDTKLVAFDPGAGKLHSPLTVQIGDGAIVEIPVDASVLWADPGEIEASGCVCGTEPHPPLSDDPYASWVVVSIDGVEHTFDSLHGPPWTFATLSNEGRDCQGGLAVVPNDASNPGDRPLVFLSVLRLRVSARGNHRRELRGALRRVVPAHVAGEDSDHDHRVRREVRSPGRHLRG